MPRSKKNFRFQSKRIHGSVERIKNLHSIKKSKYEKKKIVNFNSKPTKSVRNSTEDKQQSIITLDETGRCSPMFLEEIRNCSPLDETVDLSESDSSVLEVLEDDPVHCDTLDTDSNIYFLPKHVSEVKGSVVYISKPENYGLLTFNIDDEFILGVFSLDYSNQSCNLLLGNEIVVNAWFSAQMTNIHYMACICHEYQPGLSYNFFKELEERFYYIDKSFQFDKLNIDLNRLIRKDKTFEHDDSESYNEFPLVPVSSEQSDKSNNIPHTVSQPVTNIENSNNLLKDIPEETFSLPSTSTIISEDLIIGTEHENLKIKKEKSVNLFDFKLDTINGAIGKVLKNINDQCWFAVVFDGDKKIFEVIFDECDVVNVASPGSKTNICKPGAFIKLNSVGCNDYFKSSCHIATFVLLADKLEDIIHKKIALPDKELTTLKNMPVDKINYSKIALRSVKDTEYSDNEIDIVKEVQMMTINTNLTLPDFISQETGVLLQVSKECSVIKFSINDGEAISICFAIFDEKCKVDTSVEYKFGDLVNFNAVKSLISDYENLYVVYRVYNKLQTGKNNFEKILECSEFLHHYNTLEEFKELDWKASRVQVPDILTLAKTFSVTIKKVLRLNKKICLAKLNDSYGYGLLIAPDKGKILESMSLDVSAVNLKEYGLLRYLLFPCSSETSTYAYLEHDCFEIFHKNVDIFEAVAMLIDNSEETNDKVRKLLAAYTEQTDKKIDIEVNGVEMQVMKPFSMKTIKEQSKTSLSYESLLFFFLLSDYKLFHSEETSNTESEIQKFKDEGLSFNILSQLQKYDLLKVYNKRAFHLTSCGLLEDIPAITKWKLEHDQELIKACVYRTKNFNDLSSLVKDINSRFKDRTGIDQISSFLEKRVMFLFELSMTRGRFFMKEERSLLENAIRLVISATLTNLFGKIGLR